MDKIHALTLERAHRDRSRASVQREMLPSPHPHAQLQAIETVEPTDAFTIHRPAFAPQ
ncbi:MAG: hypothetical protein AMXMBFR7_52090 [Planctomycetota bacterium]